MLILFQSSHGQYEDYYTHIDKVYDFQKPITIEQLYEEYFYYLKPILEEVGFKVKHHHSSEMFFTKEFYQPNNFHLKTKYRKQYHKILEEHGFYIWLEKAYDVKPIEFKIFNYY